MHSGANIVRYMLVVIFFIQSMVTFGQNNEFAKGTLINDRTTDPISFATIRIKNKKRGLISNADGGFIIPYEAQKIGDTLVISSIGYASKEILLSDLKKGQTNIIKLTEKVEKLEEVKIIGSKKSPRKTARKIIRSAMDMIPENYPFKAFSYVGYYRDYQLKEGQYINMNEALLEVLDPGFGIEDIKGTRTKIYSYKKNVDFPTDTIASKPYNYVNRSKIIANATLDGQGGNEFTILRFHDAIRNYNVNAYDFVNRLNIDLIKNHSLRLLPDTFIDSIPLYVIRISKSLENIQVKGNIYISKDDFKIYKMEYAVYDTTTRHKKRGKLLFEIIVEYQAHLGIMYPNYISFNNAFEVLQPPKFSPIQIKTNYNRERFEILFNNPPLPIDAIKKRNYKLWFNKNKIKIDSIEVIRNRVLLYPENRTAFFDSKIIQSLGKENKKELVSIEVKNIRDIYDNMVYEQESLPYNQFREFFVQELKHATKQVSDSLFMIKTRPISESQTTTSPKNIADYWMNTPLKN